MDDGSRIPADANYLQAAGRAFYNFTYLEAIAIWIIGKLHKDGSGGIPKGSTAGDIARLLKRMVDETSPPLSTDLRGALLKFHNLFLTAKRTRDKLIHAHPFTTADGSQQLGANDHTWTHEELRAAAVQFQDAAIAGADIVHGNLKNEPVIAIQARASDTRCGMFSHVCTRHARLPGPLGTAGLEQPVRSSER